MVEAVQFTVDETKQATEPAVAVELNQASGATGSLSPTSIEDNVTISEEALSALPASNLLTFGAANNPDLSQETADAVGASSGSQIQKLLDEGYSLSQIAAEFDIALADVESQYGVKIFNTAA